MRQMNEQPPALSGRLKKLILFFTALLVFSIVFKYGVPIIFNAEINKYHIYDGKLDINKLVEYWSQLTMKLNDLKYSKDYSVYTKEMYDLEKKILSIDLLIDNKYIPENLKAIKAYEAEFDSLVSEGLMEIKPDYPYVLIYPSPSPSKK
jgi:hypothetical protein